MPDQADELRKLVAGQHREMMKDNPIVWLDHLGACELCQWAQGATDVYIPVGQLRIHVPAPSPMPDKARLWDGITMREEQDTMPVADSDDVVALTTPEYVIRQHGVRVGSISIKAPEVAELFALAILEHVRPATDATFARVAEDLRAKP